MRLEELAEHPLGLTWVVDDPLLRASHALVHEGRVWFVDPVDAPEAMERAAALGEPAGVLQLFMAHPRDGEAIAQRLGVPLHVHPGRAAGHAVQRAQPGPGALEGARAVVAGAEGPGGRGVARHRHPLRRRTRSGRHPHHAAPAPADPAAAVPARAPAGRARLACARGQRRRPRRSTRSTTRGASFRGSFCTRRASCAACTVAAEVGCDPCSPSTTTPSATAT